MKHKSYIITILCFLILLMALLVSCKNEPLNLSSTPTDSKLNKLDITNAKSLFIASNRTTKATSDKLFKITNDGYIEEVKSYDENGNEITLTIQPLAIYNVNKEYVIVCFGFDDEYIESGYLVRKSDGAVFTLENAGYPIKPEFSFKNGKVVFTDYSGNIYYAKYDYSDNRRQGKIIKLNTTDPNLITGETYSTFLDDVYKFVIDNNGNAIYTGYMNSTETTLGAYVSRIKKANGELYNELNITDHIFWLGLDGYVYYNSYNIDTNSNEIRKMVIDQSYNIITSPYSSLYVGIYPPNTYKLELQDRIIFIDSGSPGEPFFEVQNPSNQPRLITLSGLTFTYIIDVGCSSNYYYIAGRDENSNSVLIKVNPLNDEYEFLTDPGVYEIYKISASENDEVLFNAMKMSDGSKVIGKIDSNGNLTILDESLNAEIIVLERIN